VADSDVTSVIAKQHEETKQVLQDLLRREGVERARVFRKLRVMIALHETAEEQAVHPEAMRQLGGNDQGIKARIAEESEAGELIGKLESFDIDSKDFMDGFTELANSVIEHAQAEEEDEWPALREITDANINERMVRVMSAVPTVADDPAGLAEGATFAHMLAWAPEQLPLSS